jgi:putative intracellular protease/amidase
VEIAIPVFDQLTALDAIGPYEVLQRLPDVSVHFINKRVGEIRTDNGMLGLLADRTYADLSRPDVIVFPGGVGTRTVMRDEAILDWVRSAHETTRYTTSVCTGSLVLAAAGLLDGLEATTYWSAYDHLAALGAKPVSQRVVEQGRILTAAGVSSGIDMALRLAELLFDTNTAKAMQLMIEYDPQPPFDAGAVDKAGDDVMQRVVELSSARKG